MEELECMECDWIGNSDELLQHPDDENETVNNTRFVVCPACEGIDTFEQLEPAIF